MNKNYPIIQATWISFFMLNFVYNFQFKSCIWLDRWNGNTNMLTSLDHRYSRLWPQGNFLYSTVLLTVSVWKDVLLVNDLDSSFSDCSTQVDFFEVPGTFPSRLTHRLSSVFGLEICKLLTFSSHVQYGSLNKNVYDHIQSSPINLSCLCHVVKRSFSVICPHRL